MYYFSDMNKQLLSIFGLILILAGQDLKGQDWSSYVESKDQNWSSFVSPLIGTGGVGHTYPGATVPFGMVQLSPDTRRDGSWEGCAGYYYPDTLIYGFSHTHLSGTGCSDYGDVLTIPCNDEVNFKPEMYASAFSHSTEISTQGYYAVTLSDNNIR